MRRRLVFVSYILITISLIGCSASAHSEELADYYNSYVNTVNDLGEKIDEQTEKLVMIEDPEEALSFHNEMIVPLVQEVEEFITSVEPKSEVVQELHEMRLKQLNSWFQGFELRTEAFEEAATSGDEEAVITLIEKSDSKFYEASQHAFMADHLFIQMAREHNVKLIDD